MAVRFYDNIDYKGKKPLDARTSYATLALMKSSYSSRQLSDGLICWVDETQTQYIFNSDNTVDPVTGMWREYSKPLTSEEIISVVV